MLEPDVTTDAGDKAAVVLDVLDKLDVVVVVVLATLLSLLITVGEVVPEVVLAGAWVDNFAAAVLMFSALLRIISERIFSSCSIFSSLLPGEVSLSWARCLLTLSRVEIGSLLPAPVNHMA